MKVTDDEFIKICQSSRSMLHAAATLQMQFTTFKRRALKLNCYKTNQAGVGVNKKSSKKIPLNTILAGKHPEYQTFKLKNRLLEEGILANKCVSCGIVDWNGKPLVMELDHIDGDRTNHRLKNLRMLCPNCHALTDTYRAKNIKK